jgi:transcriptional regulator with XRE-family HTH domain
MGMLAVSNTVGGHWPVFDGLARTRVSGREIAAIAGVSPGTVRAWARGRATVPPETLALLTLVLESELEETERLHTGYGADSPAWRAHVGGRLETIRRCLQDQRRRNGRLSSEALLRGCRLFRGWSSRSAPPAAASAARG